jgi:amino acid transporter
MNHNLVALAFQEAASDNSIWIIIGVVVFLLVIVVVVVVIGLVIFFIMRKQKKAQIAASSPASASGASAQAGSVPYSEVPPAVAPELAAPLDTPPPTFEPPTPIEEMRADASEVSPAGGFVAPADFDPSRTVAITRENTVAISYGTIRFVSGVLMGQEFEIQPEGSYIGRESSLSQIVVADPRISKRHLWIGVRDGQVIIVDQDSRNGTFVNDPKSERITEATLHSGDTVILGESDVARFEYQM